MATPEFRRVLRVMRLLRDAGHSDVMAALEELVALKTLPVDIGPEIAELLEAGHPWVAQLDGERIVLTHRVPQTTADWDDQGCDYYIDLGVAEALHRSLGLVLGKVRGSL